MKPEIPEVSDLMELLVTEVVTNAVLHAGMSEGDPVALAVKVSPSRVRVEVSDPGPGFEPDRVEPPELLSTGRRGLLLLEELSDRWGVKQDVDGNLVWFELDRPDRVRGI